MRIQSRMMAAFGVFLILLLTAQSAGAATVNIGKMDANLSSAVSNSTSVTWYNFSSPYSSLPSGQQTPPLVLSTCQDSSLQVKMDYRMRDDSNVTGKSQEIKMDYWSWNPQNYTWTWYGSQSSTQSSKGWGKYNATGTKSAYLNWGSSTNVALFKVQGYAKSGDKNSTSTREFWIVRTPSKTGAGYADAPRWICDRYSRSMFYNQIAANMQQIENDSDASATSTGLDTVMRYGKNFGMPSAETFALSTGLDAFTILNSAWKTSAASGEILAGSQVMVQGLSWVQSAIALLTNGVRDAIASAQRPTMTQQAAQAAFPSLRGDLNTVANAMRDDAGACQSLVYTSGWVSTSDWQSKLDSEKAAIDAALATVGTARTQLATWRSGYDAYANVPGIGADTIANANAVRDNLASYLNYVEQQLKSDKAIVDKGASL